MKRISRLGLLAALGILASAAATLQAASPSVSSAVAGGRHLFHQDCAACHDTEGASVKTGPVLKNYYHRQPRPADSAVRELIEKGRGRMPAFGTLSTAQVNALVAYLKTL